MGKPIVCIGRTSECHWTKAGDSLRFALPAGMDSVRSMFSHLSPGTNFIVRVLFAFGAGLMIAGLL
jgi:hypothetical protein